VIPGGAAAEKTHGATVDRFASVQRRCAVDLRAETKFGVFLGAHYARLCLAQRGQHFLGIVADR
jgi:hypothetical protein